MGESFGVKRTGRRRPVGVVKAEFNEILNEASRNGWQTQCKDRSADFTDYEERPSIEDSAELCRGCVLLQECYEFGVASRASIGVYGGIPFQHGRPVVDDDEPQWGDQLAA